MKGCANCNKTAGICPENNQENIDVAAWIRFIQDLGLPKMFSALPDQRKQSQVTYSISSLAMWAFSTCAFRHGSKNAMQTDLDALPEAQLEPMLKLLGIEGKTVPHSRTVDEALSKIEFEKFNDILLTLFDRMVERKIFYNHSRLLPGNAFQIGIDGYWTHHYTHPHAVDDKGNNICPYCLPRVHNRGKENEFTTWVHVIVTFVLICGDFTLPLYIYPLKSNQVQSDQGDDKLKEECELAAARAVLPKIRKRYPRLSLMFLGDSLYANKPFLRLCNKFRIGYLIVFKDTTLPTLVKKCNELEKTDINQKYYRKQETVHENNRVIQKEASWFNNVAAGENVFTNVLRFKEGIRNSDGTLFPSYKCAWLYSKSIFGNSCFKIADRARGRWDHEDLHNTCKNREFDIKHDIARTDPNLLLIWKMMIFIAFFVFELFRCTTIAIKARKKRSLMGFAQSLLSDLLKIYWKTIVASPILQKPRVQFRFCFSCGP